MTIERLINELANLGQIHGLDAPVKVWNIGEAIQPLETRKVAGAFTGWDERERKHVATLRLEQP
jgi:hypothetical protein